MDIDIPSKDLIFLTYDLIKQHNSLIANKLLSWEDGHMENITACFKEYFRGDNKRSEFGETHYGILRSHIKRYQGMEDKERMFLLKVIKDWKEGRQYERYERC